MYGFQCHDSCSFGMIAMRDDYDFIWVFVGLKQDDFCVDLLKLMFYYFVLFLFCSATSVELYSSLSASYNIGGNLMNNYLFDSPSTPTNIEYASIPFWSCNKQCRLANTSYLCNEQSLHFYASPHSCIHQHQYCFMLGYGSTSEFLSYRVNIANAGLYLLHLEYLPPVAEHSRPYFTVELNGAVIGRVALSSTKQVFNVEEFVVNVTAEVITLSFQAISVPDYGYCLSNFSLNQLIQIESIASPPSTEVNAPRSLSTPSPLINDSQFKSIVELLILNNVTRTLNKIPGNRIFLYTLTNFFCFFDRLQFYYYHPQNFTPSASIFLSTVNTFQLQKGSIVQQIFQNCENSWVGCAWVNAQYASLRGIVDQKAKYSSKAFLDKNQKGVGFMVNTLPFLFYQIPLILLLFLFLNLTFRALFNYRVSLQLRRYSLYGTILLVFYQGNIEQFSFYYFMELKMFFSSSWGHKIVNTFIVYFFGLAVLFAVGALVWFKGHYFKLAKYLTEEYRKVTVQALVLQSLEKSIFPLLFGCTHALLLVEPLILTPTLGVIQVAYYIMKLANLKAQSIKYRFRVIVYQVTSLLRMLFIVTLYLYDSEHQPEIIQEIHRQLVWMYLATCAVQFAIDAFIFLQSSLIQIKNMVKSLFFHSGSQKDIKQKKYVMNSHEIVHISDILREPQKHKKIKIIGKNIKQNLKKLVSRGNQQKGRVLLLDSPNGKIYVEFKKQEKQKEANIVEVSIKEQKHRNKDKNRIVFGKQMRQNVRVPLPKQQRQEKKLKAGKKISKN